MLTTISKWSRIQDSFRNTPKIESLVVFAIPDMPWKFRKDPFINFWVILLTHRQTERQTNSGKNITSLAEVILHSVKRTCMWGHEGSKFGSSSSGSKFGFSFGWSVRKIFTATCQRSTTSIQLSHYYCTTCHKLNHRSTTGTGGKLFTHWSNWNIKCSSFIQVQEVVPLLYIQTPTTQVFFKTYWPCFGIDNKNWQQK